LKSDENYKTKLQDNLTRLQEFADKAASDKQLQKDIEDLRNQIREYEDAIDSRLRQRELVVARYNNDLTRYRDIVKRRQLTQ
jgi:peptidoglycan hydrolase CwlO-like protein